MSHLGRQGGDLRGFEGDHWLDLATCVNRYGPPPSVIEAVRQVGPLELQKHPYRAADELVATYASYLGVNPAQCVAGRGTTEFIWNLAQVGLKTRVPLPAYTDFIRAFPNGTVASNGEDYLTGSIREAAALGDVVLLSNPHNPTGSMISPRVIEKLAQQYPSVLFVVDESYAEFTDDPEASTVVGSSSSNVVALRSPSKFFGVAGTRTGVAWCREPANLRTIVPPRGPWPVSGLDVITARAALEDVPWQTYSHARIRDDISWFADFLTSEFSGTIHPPAANFVLLSGNGAGQLADMLETYGVLARPLGSGHGLSEPGVRIAAPIFSEREKFQRAFLACASESNVDD